VGHGLVSGNAIEFSSRNAPARHLQRVAAIEDAWAAVGC
jgi:hypothetical protein